MIVTYPNRIDESLRTKAAEILEGVAASGKAVLEMEEGDDLGAMRRALKAEASVPVLVRQPKGRPAVLIVSLKSQSPPRAPRKPRSPKEKKAQ